MDFKKLLNTLDSMEARVVTPAAPTLPKSAQLNEDAQMRVLAGQTTVLAEAELMEKAKSKAQQKAAGAALAAKRGEGTAKGASKEMAKMDTKELKKFAGTKHKGLPEKKTESIDESAIDDLLDKQKSDDKDDSGRRQHKGTRYGGSAQKDDDDADKPEAKKGRKTAKESVELDIEEFNETFSAMVEAAKTAPAKKAAVKKTDAKGAMNKMFGGSAKDLTKNLTAKKKDEKVAEGAKPDFLDIDKDGDKKEPMKKAVADKKKGAVGKKDEDVAEGKSPAQKAAQEKFKAMIGKKKGNAKEEKTDEGKMMPKGKKQSVKESVERKLTFKQMMNLVVESGGQQQIDPTDQTLFSWAQRVAKQKIGEGMRAEVYAGMIYERMGGRFEMYDVLTESMPFEADRQSLDYDSIDLGSLEVDGIDYRDAPEFSDAYFSDGSHKDGTPLEDWELEALTGDYDLLNQYVVNKVY